MTESVCVRPNPLHASDDPDVVRGLIRENPWTTLVSNNSGELVASHYPILLDEEAEGLTILTHVGRPDEVVHGTQRQVMAALRAPGPYCHPNLADDMARALSDD
jgi:transcriptional regulator